MVRAKVAQNTVALDIDVDDDDLLPSTRRKSSASSSTSEYSTADEAETNGRQPPGVDRGALSQYHGLVKAEHDLLHRRTGMCMRCLHDKWNYVLSNHSLLSASAHAAYGNLSACTTRVLRACHIF